MSWKPNKPVALGKLISTANIIPLLTKEDQNTICERVAAGYESDVQSRSEWTRRKAQANKLAMQVVEQQNWPWPQASNVKFPLVTVAALQFQARAYPSLISGTEVVKARVIGSDPGGKEAERAKRISTHMSWQCLEQDEGWEEEHDKLILATAIAGCAFTKSVFEPGPSKIHSQLVLPNNLVVNYNTRSLDDSPRYTHTFNLTANAIRQREIDERFTELPKNTEESAGTRAPVQPSIADAQNQLTDAKDQRQGIYPQTSDDATPYFTGEQYCWLDLDGDGYEEPYVVTFDIGSRVLRRIAPRFLPQGVKFHSGKKLTEYAFTDTEGKTQFQDFGEEEIYKITPVKVFTKYGFIPSPDGGFYDLGLGDLAGPINESVNTALNQLLDAGTMANLGGGFLGRAFRGRGGPITFAPNQWHPVDNGGDDIRKSIVPLPVPGPNATLFQLIGFLVQYAERIVSATEIQVGESPGQNMKAETARMLNENGARVYTAIYKRMWRSFRNEYRVRYELNALYLEVQEDYTELTTGVHALIKADDYHGSAIVVRPAADPFVVTDAEAERMGLTLVQLSNTQPNFNRYKSMLRYLKAIKVPDVDEVYPPPMQQGPNGQPQPAQDVQMPPNPKMIEAQRKMQETQIKVEQFKLEQVRFQVDLMNEVKESQAKVIELEARAAKEMAEAGATKVDPLIKLIYAQIEGENSKKDRNLKMIELIAKQLENMNAGESRSEGAAPAGHPGVAGLAGLGANAGILPPPRANGAGQPAGMGGAGI